MTNQHGGSTGVQWRGTGPWGQASLVTTSPAAAPASAAPGTAPAARWQCHWLRPVQLSRNSGACPTPSVPAGAWHPPPAHALSTFPMGLVTLLFAGEPDPLNSAGGRLPCPMLGLCPEEQGCPSRAVQGCTVSSKQVKHRSPSPLLSVAESHSPAVLINGHSRKERGLAAAPVCAELAGAASRLLPGTQAGLARYRCLPAARPAGRRACRQLCLQLALPELGPRGWSVS